MPCVAGSSPVGAIPVRPGVRMVKEPVCKTGTVGSIPTRGYRFGLSRDRPRSSAGQSACLTHRASRVRILPGSLVVRRGFVAQRQSIRLLTGVLQVRIPPPLLTWELRIRKGWSSRLATAPVLKTGEPHGLGGSTPSPSACGRSSVVRVPHCDCGDVGSTPTGHLGGRLTGVECGDEQVGTA